MVRQFFSLFWCDFSPNEILIATLQLPTIYMFKSKIRIVKKKKKKLASSVKVGSFLFLFPWDWLLLKLNSVKLFVQLLLAVDLQNKTPLKQYCPYRLCAVFWWVPSSYFYLNSMLSSIFSSLMVEGDVL